VPGADDVKPPLVPIGVHCGALWRAEPRVVADVVVAGTLTTPGLIPASPKRTLRDYAGALPELPTASWINAPGKKEAAAQ
jgi:hypothetical protein